MQTVTMNRRGFLRLAVGVGATAAAGSLVTLGGCKSGPKELSCTDTTGLAPAELAMRTQLQYVDRSPSNEKLCAGCQFFQPKGPEACGACTLVKGPIHPKGYCTSWVKKAA